MQLSTVYPSPKNWRISTIDEIKSNEPYSCVAGPFGSSISSKFFTEDGIPVIRGSNLRDDLTRFVPQNFVFLSESKAYDFIPQRVIENDLVFTCWGTIGQVGIIPNGGEYSTYIISNKQLKLRVNKDIVEPLFCYYYLASPKYVEYLKSRSIGGAVPGINLGILKSLVISFPDLQVQRSIISILSAYDDLIENNRRRIALLEQSARLLYQEWFVRFRFPGHEKVKIVDGLPEGWERKKLKDISCHINRGIAPKYDDNGSSIVINQKCIRNNMLSLDQSRKQSKPYKEEKGILFGDVLINSTGTGTLGRVAQCWIELDKCTVDSHVTIARPAKDIHILWYGFSLLSFQDYFETMGEGSTNQKELGRKTIENVGLVVPSQEIRELFERNVRDQVNQITTLTRQNKALTAARDLLLPRLMSGEIAV